MAARSITSALLRPLSNRGVRINVNPAPRDLRESRTVLRLVEGYGDVVSFTSLKVSA